MGDNKDISDTHGLKDSLTSTAIAFLRNERVKASSLEHKKAFLKNKGLTEEEIDEAIKLSELETSFQLSNNNNQNTPSNQRSFWSLLKQSFVSFVVFTGSTYILFEIYQKFISPILFKTSRKEEELFEKLLESNVELNDNMVAMVATLNDLRRQVTKNNEQLGNMKYLTDSMTVTTEIKEELKSLKALFLNRNQFPPPPPANPVIPSWQLERRSKNDLNLVSKTTNKDKNLGFDEADDDDIKRDAEEEEDDNTVKIITP